ncbi:hypothetical protein BPOR_1476g00010 [Botrytis porri]|uniref:Uncharacterized protein n=1 Tax=Botrytis porri TaxID=87229 RepID=A0A4Z1KBQ7_9HELO|nr:hypothetical protein BPOR_1476g00010 [Botrytis porri]
MPSTSKHSTSNSKSQTPRPDRKSEDSVCSHKSKSSTGTQNSQKSTSSDVSELTERTNIISEDLDGTIFLIEELLRKGKIDKESGYFFVNKHRTKWTGAMKDKYAMYKKCAKERLQSKRTFDVYKQEKCQNDPPVEFLQQLRKYAITWADNALLEVEGRSQFIDSYKRAYEGAEGFNKHLKEVIAVSNSAQKAITHANEIKKKIKEMEKELKE